MKATIEVPRDERLLDLFASEDTEISRASYEITQTEKNTVFTITADDAVALRTATAAITRMLSIWERTGDL